jgi:hypothetical protein
MEIAPLSSSTMNSKMVPNNRGGAGQQGNHHEQKEKRQF